MGAIIESILLAVRGFFIRAWPQVSAWFLLQVGHQVAKAPVRVAIMSAWAVFLAVVFTGLSGLGIVTVFNSNPLSGASSDVLGLVSSVFPLHFAFGLFSAYVVWKATINQALMIMNRVILWIFGPD